MPDETGGRLDCWVEGEDCCETILAHERHADDEDDDDAGLDELFAWD